MSDEAKREAARLIGDALLQNPELLRAIQAIGQGGEGITPDSTQKDSSGPKRRRPLTRRPGTYLTEEERDRLIAAVPSTRPAQALRDRAILTLFAYSGLRRNELRMLDRGDVDEYRMVIRVRHGKGGKTRTVPLNAKAQAAIRAYLATRRDPDPALFLSNRRQRFSLKGLWRLLERALAGAGIEQRVSLHSLRHTFATGIYRKTGDIYLVKELLGHSNIQTSTVYAHMDQSRAAGAVSEL